jgi:UDP-galactose transporter
MGGAEDGNATSHHENGNDDVDPLISRGSANDQGVLIPPGTDDTTAAKKRATSRQTNAEDGTHGSSSPGGAAAGVPGSRRRIRKVAKDGGSGNVSDEDNVQAKCIKYSALFLLVAQMVGLVLLMRYSRTSGAENEPLYLASTAVFIMEVMKLVLCLGVVWYQTGWNVIHELHHHTIGSPLEILYLCVPSLLYTVQNNLLYLALTNLDAATYQVCYQLKILTTALFSAVLLARKFSAQKWAALVVLTVGVAIVQLSGSDDQHSSGSNSGSTTTDHHEAELELAAAAAAAHQNRLVGLIAVICAACTSGFSGVYFGTCSCKSTRFQHFVFLLTLFRMHTQREFSRVVAPRSGFATCKWVYRRL